MPEHKGYTFTADVCRTIQGTLADNPGTRWLAQTLPCRSARRRRNSHNDRRPEGSAPACGVDFPPLTTYAHTGTKTPATD